MLGSYGMVGELFQSETETYRPPPPRKPAPGTPNSAQVGSNPLEEDSRDQERLKFNDHVVQGDLFVPWKPYKHPQFGDIEIGGWVKMSNRLPHPFMLQDLVHRNVSAVLFSASQTPEVRLELVKQEVMGPNLHRVRLRLANAHAIPSMTFNAVVRRIHPMDQLRLEGKGLKVITGGPVMGSPVEQVVPKAHKPELQFLQVPGYGKVEYEFLVEGTGDLKVHYQGQKAGGRDLKIRLERP